MVKTLQYDYKKIQNIYKAKIKALNLVNKITGETETIKLIDNHLLVYRDGEIIEIDFNDLRNTDKIVKL